LLAFGAGDGDAIEMLDGALPGVGSFRSADTVRQMTDEGNVLLAGFVSEGKIRIAWNVIVDFDEVGTVRLDFVHGAAGIVGFPDDNGTFPNGRVAIDDGAAEEDFRRNRNAGEFGTQIRRVLTAEHQAHAGHAIGDVEREVLKILDVDVHVPEAGDQESPVGIDDAALRWVCGIERGNGRMRSP
jgi:hypothetical protein